MNIEPSNISSCLCDPSFCALTPPLCLSWVTSRRKCTMRTVLPDQTTGTVSSPNFMMYLILGAIFLICSYLVRSHAATSRQLQSRSISVLHYVTLLYLKIFCRPCPGQSHGPWPSCRHAYRIYPISGLRRLECCARLRCRSAYILPAWGARWQFSKRCDGPFWRQGPT